MSVVQCRVRFRWLCLNSLLLRKLRPLVPNRPSIEPFAHQRKLYHQRGVQGGGVHDARSFRHHSRSAARRSRVESEQFSGSDVGLPIIFGAAEKRYLSVSESSKISGISKFESVHPSQSLSGFLEVGILCRGSHFVRHFSGLFRRCDAVLSQQRRFHLRFRRKRGPKSPNPHSVVGSFGATGSKNGPSPCQSEKLHCSFEEKRAASRCLLDRLAAR